MKLMVLSSSPNKDGLTAACARAAVESAVGAGAEAYEVRLNDAGIGMCKACGNGWGTCREEHRCKETDGFQAVHQQIVDADAVVLVTPVYWGDMSESAKAFTDRLRRCEAGRLKEKPFVAVAAAGGSGNGLVTCLAGMERLIQHLGGSRFDMVSVNRWNRAYKIQSIRETTAALVRSSASHGT
jgi:multimeric flavodoxin WrbA